MLAADTAKLRGGTTVVGGMLAITILGVLLVPGFYVAVERLALTVGRAEARHLPWSLSDEGLAETARELKRRLALPTGALVHAVAPSDPLLAFDGVVESVFTTPCVWSDTDMLFYASYYDPAANGLSESMGMLRAEKGGKPKGEEDDAPSQEPMVEDPFKE